MTNRQKYIWLLWFPLGLLFAWLGAYPFIRMGHFYDREASCLISAYIAYETSVYSTRQGGDIGLDSYYHLAANMDTAVYGPEAAPVILFDAQRITDSSLYYGWLPCMWLDRLLTGTVPCRAELPNDILERYHAGELPVPEKPGHWTR